MCLFCHGKKGFLLIILLLALRGFSLPDGDLCNWMNGRKYYIDLGDSGIISAENVTSQRSAPGSNSQPRIPQRCSVELITCPSCHILVSILHLNIPLCSTDNSCRCDYLWIREPAYSKSGQMFCGFRANESSWHYESETKLVSIDFLYSYSYDSAFSLQFTAKKNKFEYKGGHEFYHSNSTGFFHSPYFPMKYPADYSAVYIIRNVDNNGYVQLLFTDFQLSPWSFIEIFDSNGSRIDEYNGNTFRPPIVMSSGPTLTVKFRANDEYSSSGFKAKYTFVNYAKKYWINKPSTDCGGFVDDYGGAITMMNMASGPSLRAYDCIWLIHPHYVHSYETHISIRVAQFEEMGPKSTLAIHQGLNSETYLLESVTSYHHHKIPRGQEYVVPISSGFYIRLTGSFNNKSHLAIIYATFKYDECYLTEYFECGNGRCLRKALGCDGFNHCGDGSDEATCYGAGEGTVSPDDANWWRTLTPNYYFPKQDSTSSAGANTLILVTSLAGLGMFVLTTVMILVKLHRQRQEDAASREFLHTISRDVDTENNSGTQHNLSGDPPLYDPPPSYEDVIKFYMPPPPNYSSIIRAPGPAADSTGGVDNIAFVPDSSPLSADTNVSSCRPQVVQTARERIQSQLSELKVLLTPGQANLKNQATNLSTGVQSRKGDETTFEAEMRGSDALLTSSEPITQNPFSSDLSVDDTPKDFITESFQTSLSDIRNKKDVTRVTHLVGSPSDATKHTEHLSKKSNKLKDAGVIRHKSSESGLCYCRGACSCPMPRVKGHKSVSSQGKSHPSALRHSSPDIPESCKTKGDQYDTEYAKQGKNDVHKIVDVPVSHNQKTSTSVASPLATTVTFSTSEMKISEDRSQYKVPTNDRHKGHLSNSCQKHSSSSQLSPKCTYQSSVGTPKRSANYNSPTNSCHNYHKDSAVCGSFQSSLHDNKQQELVDTPQDTTVQDESVQFSTNLRTSLDEKLPSKQRISQNNKTLCTPLGNSCLHADGIQCHGNSKSSDKEPLLRRVSSQPFLCNSTLPTHKHSKSDGSGAVVNPVFFTSVGQNKTVAEGKSVLP